MQSGDEEALKEIIRDALCGKSIATLKSRVASITSFGRWKKSMSLPYEVSIFPISEDMAYRYVCDLRKEGAPKSRATRFLEAVGFCKGMLGADVDEVLASSRVKGACINRLNTLEPRKKDPLTVEQISFLEYLACHRTDHLGIFCGYLCFLVYGRLRWTDGQFCREEPWLDEGPEFSYLEARLYHHKTAGRAKTSRRLLPVACPVPGVSRLEWAQAWLTHRREHGLVAGVGKPTMPAPHAIHGWSTLPLSSSDASNWLREILGGQGLVYESQAIGTHSAKATVLSWMCKAHSPGDLQRLAGYHVDPNSKSALEYSRDSQAPVVRFIEGMLLVIFSGLFKPDVTRSGRWQGCRSLEQALDMLARRRGDDAWDGDWEHVEQHTESQPVRIFRNAAMELGEDPERDGLASVAQSEESGGALNDVEQSESEPELFHVNSSASEGDCENDLEEDENNMEIAGDAIAGLVHAGGDLETRVFRHRISGIFHLMTSADGPDEDGDMSSTKCGKLISHNFEEVDSSVSFLPSKCKRCFTQ
eukprot:s3084_g2.t1